MISDDANASRFNKPRCGPGGYRCFSSPCSLRPPAVKADNLALLVVQRHDDAAVKMFVAAVAPQAKLRQPRSQHVAFLAILLRQPQAQRPVGEAELKTRQ